MVTLNRVGYTYQNSNARIEALANVSISFLDGTSTALLGRSGSGKSTFVTLLACLRRPSCGNIYYWGRDSSELNDDELAELRNQQIGLVFQSFHLDLGTTALENILLPWYFQTEISHSSAIKNAKELLESLGIPDLQNRKVGQMSGGQRQRVAIARALLLKPKLLIADEPTGNLDEETANEVSELLLSMPNRFGTTLLIVTHDELVASKANSVIRITGGKLEESLA